MRSANRRATKRHGTEARKEAIEMNEKKKKQLIERSKRDATKAGRMFLDAVFGDTDEFLEGLEHEGEDEACDDDALTVQGYMRNEDEIPSTIPSTKPYGGRR